MKLSIRELFNAVVEEAVDQHLVLGTEVEELLVVAEDWMEVNSIYTKSNFFVRYIEHTGTKPNFLSRNSLDSEISEM